MKKQKTYGYGIQVTDKIDKKGQRHISRLFYVFPEENGKQEMMYLDDFVEFLFKNEDPEKTLLDLMEINQ